MLFVDRDFPRYARSRRKDHQRRRWDLESHHRQRPIQGPPPFVQQRMTRTRSVWTEPSGVIMKKRSLVSALQLFVSVGCLIFGGCIAGSDTEPPSAGSVSPINGNGTSCGPAANAPKCAA